MNDVILFEYRCLAVLQELSTKIILLFLHKGNYFIFDVFVPQIKIWLSYSSTYGINRVLIMLNQGIPQ